MLYKSDGFCWQCNFMSTAIFLSASFIIDMICITRLLCEIPTFSVGVGNKKIKKNSLPSLRFPMNLFVYQSSVSPCLRRWQNDLNVPHQISEYHQNCRTSFRIFKQTNRKQIQSPLLVYEKSNIFTDIQYSNVLE